MSLGNLERKWMRWMRKIKKHKRGSTMALSALRELVAKGVVRLLWRLS